MRLKTGFLICFVGLALSLLFSAPSGADSPPVGPPLAVPRIEGSINLDGKLDDDAWQKAAVLDSFYETYPGDNSEPATKTVVYLTYDAAYFYIGIHAFDPEPARIRAP